MLRIALPNKGSLAEGAAALVAEAGYSCGRSAKELSRVDSANDVEFFFLRPRDIATYVSRGVIELGITGRDLNEDAAAPAREVLALGFGRSSFRYAVPAGSGLVPEALGGKRVACSYKNIVERDLARRGVSATVVKVDGAVEISIKLGVADAVADVVESGSTLRQAGLEVVGEPVMLSEAIVVARDVSAADLPAARKFLRRVRGIVVARDYEMVEYDIPRSALEQAVALTPGFESPTIAPLNDPVWVAVKALCRKKGLAETMDSLEAIGAKGIVAMPVRAARI
ncbi:MAG: ATP phosphoribosyltransferase [Kiritimatiellae bacterium]|nr:ATP phosphoribosyltransferase [Kiritimatiellia bacterium]MBR1836394.1 ATP phosphoribosyltransferase [Kiritimatiellia bacterium]